MRAGPLRDRVSVVRVTVVNNGGVPVEVPSVIYDRVPAEVMAATVAQVERVFAAQVQANASHVVRMRELPGLIQTDRLTWHDKYGDRVLHIQGFGESARKRERLIAVVEGIR